jgi:hypothetical protein
VRAPLDVCSAPVSRCVGRVLQLAEKERLMTFADVTPNLVARLALVAIIALILASVASGAGKEAFGLAVLRRDGMLIPFASFDGKKWSVDWPASDTGVPLPIGMDDVPRRWWGAPGPGASWTAWILDGPARPLRLLKPAHIPVFCGGRLALATDYRGGAFDPREPTVPKDSLANTYDN